MIKSDKGKKVFGAIVILAIIVSVFGGIVSAVDLSGEGVTQSVTDVEIQTEVGNLSSEELAKAVDAVTDDTVNIEFADQSSRSSYDPQAAVNYATNYAHKACGCGGYYGSSPPPQGSGTQLTTSGGDCAHFVSHCLAAGGLSNKGTAYATGWCEGGAHDYIISVSKMRQWFTDTGIATKVSSVSQLEPGDVIVTNNYGHVVLYIGTYGGNTNRVASHSAWGIFSYTYFGTPNEYWHISTSSVQKPTVETRSATSITETAATLNGEITDDGGASIDERRFSWGTTSSCSDGWITDDPSSDHYGYFDISGNSFSYRLTGLESDKIYYFQAWAHNSAGWSNGAALSFTTLPQNQPPIASASDISNQPDVMHPDTLYEVRAKYYDPDGRANLDLCTLVLSHPSDDIMMGWGENLKVPIEDSPYITYLDVVYTQITDSYEGYQLTWKFKLSDTWPEAENCIDFCVLATDDDGLRSELDCDNTDASFVVNQPDIRQPISSIGFGDVTVGNSLDKTTTIYNDGTGTLTINSITRSSGSSDFAYIGPSTPFDIAAGGSRTTTVRFAPSSTGSKSANFNVNSNDPDEANVPFSVSGNGIGEPDIRQPISPISFGDVTVGNSLDKTTTIYNDGTHACSVKPTLT